MSQKTLRFGAVGIDHRHIFGMAENMMTTGAVFAGWWTQGEPETKIGFEKRFPDVPRVDTADALLEDETIDLILISSIPRDRADWAVRAMQRGKDVMVDKPGCTTLEQLATLKACVAETGRIWSVDFSERFEVASVTKATELVEAGAIGEVIQTTGLGPHRLNRSTRPNWFFDRQAYGGILCDIGSHQIDQFLHFAKADDAEILLAEVGNFANHGDLGLQDFGQLVLRAGNASAFIRVDWYTPDALPTWGDGRLTILGTHGTIELRKYVDIARSEATDHLYLVNQERCEHIDASQAGYPYFERLTNDIANRTETAMAQSHCFKVMELALKAQEMAEANARS